MEQEIDSDSPSELQRVAEVRVTSGDSQRVRAGSVSGSQPRWSLWLWLLGPLGILLTAALLRVGSERQVLLPWIDVALPETCALYARLGLDCPGCGLTRGFIHIAHGQPMVAWQVNPASWLMFAYVMIQVPIAWGHLSGLHSRWWTAVNRGNQALLAVIMGVLFLRWVILIALRNLPLGGVLLVGHIQ